MKFIIIVHTYVFERNLLYIFYIRLDSTKSALYNLEYTFYEDDFNYVQSNNILHQCAVCSQRFHNVKARSQLVWNILKYYELL